MVKALLDDASCPPAEVFSGNAEVQRKVAGGQSMAQGYLCEAAGLMFFKRYESRGDLTLDDLEDDDESDDDESGTASPTSDSHSPKGNKADGAMLKLPAHLEGVKLYKLLDVPEGASQDDLKKAYRKLALECHPDKMGHLKEAEAKQVQENFVKIQEAYEILSDPIKRRLYDSTLPFDDSMPKFKPDSSDDFYAIFDECFQRNARFSLKKPVPRIGDADTSMKQVKAFYDFWFDFQTWRDGLAMAQAADEELEDIEQAECREEKRYIQRLNAKIGRKYSQMEKDRLNRLTALAEKYDPRIAAEKEAKKAARAAEAARKHEEKYAVQRKKEEEERKKREEEERIKAEAEEKRKAEKAVKDAAKAEVKKSRQRVRSLHAFVAEFVMIEQLQEVCLEKSKEELDSLADGIEAALKNKKKEKGVEAAVKLFYQAIESMGLTPMTPEKEEEDEVSTVSGGPSEVEDPEVAAERARKEAEREARRQAEEAKKAEEKARQAAIAAEERRKREEKKKADQAAADAKRAQQEKKEREKAKKEEEKKRKAEEAAEKKKEEQKEQARLKAIEQAEKDRAAQAELQAAKEQERIENMFDKDRIERMDALEKLGEQELKDELQQALESDDCLRGALQLLKNNADIDEDQRRDCLMVLIMKVGIVWHLGLENPPDVKLPNTTRNKAKKCRQRLRDQALKWFNGLKANFGKDAVKAATEWQRGMVDGLYEWPVWNVADREAELAARGETVAPVAAVVEEAAPAAEAAAEASPAAESSAAGAGGKKKKGKAPAEEEDLDALFNEFGITIEEKKGKKKNKK